MLASSRAQIIRSLEADAIVLDVGGWGRPFARANWVIDLMPYETRGLYGAADPDPERFTAASWITRDICHHDPWPFADGQFDFVVCSHTLEDIRDPIWVCEEMNRVAKAGYIEVPARVEEQTHGIHGPWVGWSHHHWLVDVQEDGVQFVLKPHLLHGRREFWVDGSLTESLPVESLVSKLFWRDSFTFFERIFYEPDELHRYLRAVVDLQGPDAEVPEEVPATPWTRLGRRLRALQRSG